jgi:hypothetical protein
MTLDDLLALAEKATPGPWGLGWWTGQEPNNRYHNCDSMGALVGWLTGGADGKSRYHVHERDLIEDEHAISRMVEPFTRIAGNYDYEVGGIVEPDDARYIAAVHPEVVKALVAVAQAAQGVKVLIPSEMTVRLYNGGETARRRRESGLALRDALDALKAVLAP